MPSGIKSKVKSYEWKTRKKDSNASKDCSFKNYPTLEGCTYHLEKNKDYINDNVTYVTLEIYINGSSEPIVSNTLIITASRNNLFYGFY